MSDVDRNTSQLSHVLRDDHLSETLITSDEVFAGSFLKVQRDWVNLPQREYPPQNAAQSDAVANIKATASREYFKHPGGVMIIPLMEDGTVLVERRYRHPHRQIFTEFPAGKIDPHEPPAKTAIRELREETGYHAAQIAHITTIHNAIAYSDERIELYLACGLTQGPQSLDEAEFINTAIVSTDWLKTELRAHRLSDVKTQIGLSWLLSYQCGEVAWPVFVSTAGIEA